MLSTENINVPAASPELIKELARVKPGVLTAFVSSDDAVEKIGYIVRGIAMGLGMRFEYELLPTEYLPLRWSLAVRRVSALDPGRPRYSVVRLGDVHDPPEVGRFLRGRLFDVIDESDSAVEFYEPKPQSADCSCDADFLPMPKSMLCVAGDDESIDEDELDLEKKRWVDALSALIVQYMTRFHEAPPMSLIEANVRGKILLSASKKSPLTVSGDMKIYLPELNEIQLRMTPLATTVYILFLCHPEGIRLKNIADYRRELAEIYSMVKPGASEDVAKVSIDELVNPMGNSLNEKLSMIRRSVNRYILDKEMARNYIISGKRGELYRIALDADLIRLPDSLKSLKR